MICSVKTLGITGIHGAQVVAECYISNGLPGFDIVGLPDAAVKEARERVRGLRGKKTVGIFIGPEGGFEESEVAQAQELGIQPVTLGRRILRTETAGLTTLSILMYLLEE